METIVEGKNVSLLTLREVEHILKRRVSTLRKDIAKRQIAHVRLGRQIRISRQTVDELIAAGWRESIRAGSAPQS